MSVSDEYLAYITEQFSELGIIRTRRMFGGVGIYLGERFFALIDNDTLYLKANKETEPRFREAGQAPFQPWAGHVMSYWTVPGEVIENKQALAQWSQGALAAAKEPTKHISLRTQIKKRGTSKRVRRH